MDGIADAARRKPHIGLRREREPMGSWSRGPHRFEAVLYDAAGHGWVLVHPEDRARGRVESYDHYGAGVVAREAAADLDLLSPSAYAEKWAVPPEVVSTRRHPS